MTKCAYTIGHSNHSIAAFIALLRRHGVNAICDVRSHPYSRFVPQYSQEPLKAALAAEGIAYAFVGKELGARSNNPACYKQGKVQFELLAQEPAFADGIRRVIQGMARYSIALMCAEKDPIDCHRGLLVARKLFEAGIPVNHILAEGTIEAHEAMEARLLAMFKLPEGDMFKSRADFVADAYSMQAERVAYQDEAMAEAERTTAL